MIKASDGITIIYGGRAKEYATKMKEMLNLEKKRHAYPINVQILLERVISCDVLGEVLKIIKDTKLAIIFLTKDDVIATGAERKYRSRQNVILEIGMALAALPYESCIFLADFDTSSSDYELPSDLKKLFPTYFNASTIDDVFSSVIAKVRELLELKDYSDLIYKNNYYFKYSELFSSAELVEIYKEPGALQADMVLRLWLNELKSLDDIPQALIYTLERLPLTNLYRYSKYHEEWFNEVASILRKLVDNEPNELYRLTLELIDGIIKYTSIKADLSNKLITNPQAQGMHLELYEELKDITLELKEMGSINNNILINAYDYLALEAMRCAGAGKDKSLIKDAISLFNECLEIARANDDTVKLWSGYLEFNLARAYDKYIALYNDREPIDKLLLAIKRAIRTRRKWLKVPTFPECLNNAMGYEYFNALIVGYNLEMKYSYDKERLALERREIEAEFKHYYSSDQANNQLLFEIKNLIDTLE